MTSKGNWEYILKDATLCYRKRDIANFIRMWNDGEPIGVIADQLFIRVFEVGLLVMHCEMEDLITARPGGLLGTKKAEYRKRKDATR